MDNYEINGCDDEISSNEPLKYRVPSLSEFKNYYNMGNYLEAIGVEKYASTEEILSAIDSFEFEHWEQSQEWTIPLQHIKKSLLNPSENISPISSPNKMPNIEFSLLEIQNFLLQAFELQKNYQYDDALKIIDQIIEIAPFAECYDFKAEIYREMGENYGGEENFLKAIESYKTAIKINPDYERSYSGIALAYVDLDGPENMKKAKHYYKLALSHSPTASILYFDKMELEICMGKYDNALGTFGEISSLISSKGNELIASYLISLALALSGRDYNEYMDILFQEDIGVAYNWSVLPIENHLKKLKKQEFDKEKLSNSYKIHELFKKHINRGDSQ